MAYYFGQIVLYRPFLHYLAKKDGKPSDGRQQQCALYCLKAASSIISRSEVMFDRGYLCPASWVSLYTIFLSALCLVFLLATTEKGSAPVEAQKRVEAAVKILSSLRCLDTGAEKCLSILKVCENVFD